MNQAQAYVELSRRQTTISVSKCLDRHNNKNQRDGNHQEAERDISSILNASFARRESSRVYAINSPVAQDECQVAQRIKDRIRHRSEQRQRTRSNGSVDLEDSQADIGLHNENTSQNYTTEWRRSARDRNHGGHTMNDPCTAILYCKLSLSCFSFASLT